MRNLPMTFWAVRHINSWIARSTPNYTLKAVADNGLVYCAVGDAGAVAVSSDGVTWTAGGNTGFPMTAIVAVGTRFVAGSSTLGVILTSDNNGASWVQRTGIVTQSALGLAYNGSIVVASGSVAGNVPPVQYSADSGVTWTAGNLNTTATHHAVAWNGVLFISVGNNGIARSSNDGAVWVAAANTNNNGYDASGVTAIGSRFVAVGTGRLTTPQGAYTTDNQGASWTTGALPVLTWNGIASDGTILHAVSSGTVANQAIVSLDNGTTWATEVIPSSTQAWYDITYGRSLFVACGVAGASLTGIMTLDANV